MVSEMMKVVMVEPNKPAYVTEIEHSLKGMQEAVGGFIESIYYLNDPNAVMVGNEEAKLIGMDGNRRFGNRIVAGPFFICGEKLTDEGMDFCSLSDELCEKYVQEFSQPQAITQDEVQKDMGFTFVTW